MEERTPAPLSMQVHVRDAVWRTALAPHEEALLMVLTERFPSALPDELTEDVDLTALLGDPAPIVLPSCTRLL